MRCADEERRWTEGGPPTVIDTTFEHQTWNAGPEPCYVLLIDFWSPGLKTDDRRALEEFMVLEDADMRKQMGSMGPSLRQHGVV